MGFIPLFTLPAPFRTHPFPTDQPLQQSCPNPEPCPSHSFPEAGIHASCGLTSFFQEPPSLACQSGAASASSCPPCAQQAQTSGSTSQAEGAEHRASQGKGQPQASQGSPCLGVCSPPGLWLAYPWALLPLLLGFGIAHSPPDPGTPVTVSCSVHSSVRSSVLQCLPATFYPHARALPAPHTSSALCPCPALTLLPPWAENSTPRDDTIPTIYSLLVPLTQEAPGATPCSHPSPALSTHSLAVTLPGGTALSPGGTAAAGHCPHPQAGERWWPMCWLWQSWGQLGDRAHQEPQAEERQHSREPRELRMHLSVLPGSEQRNIKVGKDLTDHRINPVLPPCSPLAPVPSATAARLLNTSSASTTALGSLCHEEIFPNIQT